MPNIAKGKNPSVEQMREFAKAPNFVWNEAKQKGYFINQNPQARHIKRANFLAVLKYYLLKPKNAIPNSLLPCVKSDFSTLFSKTPLIAWLGHSSIFLHYKGLNILVDPLFGHYAAPKPYINKAFHSHSYFSEQDFSKVDIVLITHDHYDHLDYQSILALKDRARHFITPLGVGSHLRFWGVENVSELNWWESMEIEGIKITCTPSQHSSGRGVEWHRTLWSSYVLSFGERNIFLSGDGGYYTHFRDIGERFSIDLALLENGQYNTAWRYSHSFTHEVLQSALDLQAKMIIPIHYGRFVAGTHAWNEPLKNLIKLCKEHNKPICAPKIGELYALDSKPLLEEWWEF